MFKTKLIESGKGKAAYLLVIALIFISLVYYLTRPLIIVESEDEILFSAAVSGGVKFSTRFIHSVQKTPVEEYFEVNDDCSGFILKSTKYQSFGVGLPFLESDGTFRQEGNYFIMDNLNRPIKILELRTGVGTELTLKFEDQILPLYEMIPIGSLVTVSIRN